MGSIISLSISYTDLCVWRRNKKKGIIDITNDNYIKMNDEETQNEDNEKVFKSKVR